MTKPMRMLAFTVVVAYFSAIIYFNTDRDFSWLSLLVPLIVALFGVSFISGIIKSEYSGFIYFSIALVLLLLGEFVGYWTAPIFLLFMCALNIVLED